MSKQIFSFNFSNPNKSAYSYVLKHATAAAEHKAHPIPATTGQGRERKIQFRPKDGILNEVPRPMELVQDRIRPKVTSNSTTCVTFDPFLRLLEKPLNKTNLIYNSTSRSPAPSRKYVNTTVYSNNSNNSNNRLIIIIIIIITGIAIMMEAPGQSASLTMQLHKGSGVRPGRNTVILTMQLHKG